MKKCVSNPILQKNISQFEILNALNRSELTRERIIKQLEQLDLDVSQYANLSLNELVAKVDLIMRNTFSIKYLGLNKNQMGIVSKRINPLADQKFKAEENHKLTFSIHKYFYPKPLKAGKRKESAQKIDVGNLQAKIKKEFQENSKSSQKKKEENHGERMRTKMAGSWCNFHKGKAQKLSLNNQNRYSINEVAQSIQPKPVCSISFSRLLGKGMLIIRD